ncbi:IS982 family transposase [Wolbachia endosymbiont of Cylisticus convexus]|nr:IS982 family transposase [Wolbachia endosymbiont of Cylisticus convexus]
MKKDITELYCCVEDFCCAVDDNFANRFLSNGKKPTRVPEIVHSEILTIYYQSPCKNFKSLLSSTHIRQVKSKFREVKVSSCLSRRILTKLW